MMEKFFKRIAGFVGEETGQIIAAGNGFFHFLEGRSDFGKLMTADYVSGGVEKLIVK